MSDQLIIAQRFHGPPASGNGGYVGGMLAEELGRSLGTIEAVQVSLRAAVPLERPLALRMQDDGDLLLLDGEQLLAQARATTLEASVPTPPALEEARAAGVIGRMLAAKNSSSPYLQCFGCGIERAEHDGLRIRPSPAGEAEQVASDWTPDAAFADDAGHIPLPVIWAALDCPGGFAWGFRLGTANVALLTAQMTLAMVGEVRPGQAYIVTAWPLERDGRKLYAGSALHDADGKLLAWAHQLWIEPRS